MTQEIKEKFYRELLDEMYVQLRKSIYRGCGDWDLADDVVQETFLEAYRRLDIIISHPKPEGWLYVTAKKKLMKMIKKKGTLYPVEDEYLVVEVEEEKYGNIELAETIKSAVTEEEFQMLCDYFVNGYTSVGIAEKYHVPESNVRMKMSRLKKKIQEKLPGIWAFFLIGVIGGFYGL